MNAFESNVSDAEIVEAFKNTDFGTKAHRKLLEQAVLKKAVGYHCGQTITCIMTRLCLIGDGGRITKKGQRFLQHAYNHLMMEGP